MANLIRRGNNPKKKTRRVKHIKSQRAWTKDNKCSLFPYEVTEVLSLQEAKQQAGWNITAFDLPDVWKMTRGEGVKIAVLDTGCDLDHPDLKANLLPGKNFVNTRKKPWDDNQHGTHVTGIICAENNDIGMVGVAPAAKVVPIKVLDENGNGNLLDVAEGIHWAVKQNVDMMCMSLGSPREVKQVRSAIQYAAKKGIPCFVAAGNAGKTKEVFYPAAYPETIAIGSIDAEFDRSSFSNTGKNLDFMAPGRKIFSTVPDDWYAILSGTSMACPFVVGVAANALSYVRRHKVDIKLETVEDYRQAFKRHTIPITDKGYAGQKFFQGFGIINPTKFMDWLEKNGR
jgi:subtilisin family serine protease